MKISYITTYDATDIHNWSGLGYYISNALANQNAEIEYIGNLDVQSDLWLNMKRMYYHLANKSYDISRDPNVAKGFSKQAESRISLDSDIIFSPGSIPIANIKSNKPKVIYTDATFAGMINYYDNYSNFCNETIRQANLLEQKALDESSLVIYASDWAAQTAINHYKVNPDKIKVVPFGANISEEKNIEEIKKIVKNRSRLECHLLFIGVEWQRKGGDIAVEITERLNELGLKTTLHVVGMNKLPIHNLPDFIINHGFISKSSPEGIRRMEQLFEENHFLLVPSKAEAFGLVYAEANAFAMPSFATKTGGITTVIKDDINGKTFSLDALVDDWVKYIFTSFTDSKRYHDFCLSSYAEFKDRLNWNIAGISLMKLLRDI